MQIKFKPLRRQGETRRRALPCDSLKKVDLWTSLKFMQLAPGLTLKNGSILFGNEWCPGSLKSLISLDHTIYVAALLFKGSF